MAKDDAFKRIRARCSSPYCKIEVLLHDYSERKYCAAHAEEHGTAPKRIESNPRRWTEADE